MKHCCEQMRSAVEDYKDCKMNHDPFPCSDQIIVVRKDGRRGILIHDGGSSILIIRFCPWCGHDSGERDLGRMIEV
jgi:hypothetical protein